MEEKMKFDIISFGIGFAVAGLVVLIVYLIGNKLRHKCKYPDCGCKTTTYYRMIRIHNVPVTKGGLSIYAVYKFRVCDHNHVLPEMKTKMFSQEQIRSKPASEFDWSSDHINRICALAGIRTRIISLGSSRIQITDRGSQLILLCQAIIFGRQ